MTDTLQVNMNMATQITIIKIEINEKKNISEMRKKKNRNQPGVKRGQIEIRYVLIYSLFKSDLFGITFHFYSKWISDMCDNISAIG